MPNGKPSAGPIYSASGATAGSAWLRPTSTGDYPRSGIAKRPLPGNLWIGVSVEDQATADARIPLLMTLPATVRFVSCEPLLGPVLLVNYSDRPPILERSYLYSALPVPGFTPQHRVDWVIAGGESGPHARPAHPDWFRSLRDQCKTARVPFFFKQWGEYAPCEQFPGLVKPRPVVSLDGQEGGMVTRVGKKAAGRVLDGRTWDEVPGKFSAYTYSSAPLDSQAYHRALAVERGRELS